MNYELLCEVLLEVLQEYRTQLQKFQSNFGHTNSQVEILQSINNGLLSELEELQSEKTNLLLHRNSLQAENNKLILERDELKTDLKEQIDAGMWLKHEIGKVIKDRDQLRDDTARLAKGWDDCENKLKKARENFELAQSVVADLQLKNDEKRQLLKERGVIIDDSIVKEEPK